MKVKGTSNNSVRRDFFVKKKKFFQYFSHSKKALSQKLQQDPCVQH